MIRVAQGEACRGHHGKRNFRRDCDLAPPPRRQGRGKTDKDSLAHGEEVNLLRYKKTSAHSCTLVLRH